MSAASQAAAAKARAKYGKMLRLADYKAMLIKSSVNDVVNTLKSLPGYSSDFSALGSASVRRGIAEETMEKRLYRINNQLCSFIPNSGFSGFWLKELEANLVINAAMYIHAGVQDMFIFNAPVYIAERCSYNITLLAKAKSYPELVAALEGTRYHKLLTNLNMNSAELPSVRDIEYVLGYDYFETLLKSIKKEFSSSERSELEKCVLRSVDTYNIQLVYRLKGLFGLSKEEVMKYRMPFHGRFSDAVMNETLDKCESEPILSVLSNLPFFYECRNRTDFDFEYEVKKANLKYYKQRLSLSQSGYVVMYALMQLLEIERTNITTVIEGVRYALDPMSIENMLVL